MAICPLCNGFQTISYPCNKCGTMMEDTGKLSDYFDDYSAYMEIDLMKLEDGFNHSFENGDCLHLMQCPACMTDIVITINE
ncbi:MULTISPECIES: hypothetical protein [Sutcliffiella]|uniref:Uncharacterized protein n=1 Tax=Sutcliffiella cohnii TaxID=33932 RepID=A0A223KM34_9BACI|nr:MULTISPECIES: hypothetical protein [Sutcliffiella]AST90456.1 hypothetical protein BC6307_03780 [Sutcliffiella cohnii]WBL16107.1 hypothetical protein O1A01_05595 [Sutcliffiella sp. NC1]